MARPRRKFSRDGARQSKEADEGELPSKRRRRRVRIARTPVGKGVFSVRRYQQHAIIGQIEGEVIADIGYTSPYCFDLEDGRQLEPFAPFRFVNHSCEPNCAFEFFDTQDAAEGFRRIFLLALREIKPGEELTIDYNWPASGAIPCRCGAPSCRGWIVAPSQLANVPLEG